MKNSDNTINYIFSTGLKSNNLDLSEYIKILCGTQKEVISLRPERIIYNPSATIVYWNDGTKTVVKTNNEEFRKDHGLAMAFVRRIYGSRAEFLRDVESGYEPKPIKEQQS